ncbi:MAG: DUF5698 domain-containing protein [Eubacteriales bacterium]
MGILLYFLIFFAKILEVSLATTRIVLITRGVKVIGSLIGLLEVLIWVVLVSTVLTNITEDPFKLVAYALGFSIGNYVGSTFEQRLGIGTVRIEAIVMEEHGLELANRIRAKGFAVTVMEGDGMNFKRNILLMNIPRKNQKEVAKMIREIQGNVVITINDIKPVYGGYGVIKK